MATVLYRPSSAMASHICFAVNSVPESLCNLNTLGTDAVREHIWARTFRTPAQTSADVFVRSGRTYGRLHASR